MSANYTVPRNTGLAGIRAPYESFWSFNGATLSLGPRRYLGGAMWPMGS